MKNPGYRFEVYADAQAQWRWRLRYRGYVMADSGEGYVTKSNCLRALRRLGLQMLFARVDEVTQ